MLPTIFVFCALSQSAGPAAFATNPGQNNTDGIFLNYHLPAGIKLVQISQSPNSDSAYSEERMSWIGLGQNGSIYGNVSDNEPNNIQSPTAIDLIDPSKSYTYITGDMTCGAAIAQDGTVTWWKGRSWVDPTDDPFDNYGTTTKKYIDVTSTGNYIIAIDEDGYLEYLAIDNSTSTPSPGLPQGSGFIDVESECRYGDWHAALNADGTVTSWGNVPEGMPMTTGGDWVQFVVINANSTQGSGIIGVRPDSTISWVGLQLSQGCLNGTGWKTVTGIGGSQCDWVGLKEDGSLWKSSDRQFPPGSIHSICPNVSQSPIPSIMSNPGTQATTPESFEEDYTNSSVNSTLNLSPGEYEFSYQPFDTQVGTKHLLGSNLESCRVTLPSFGNYYNQISIENCTVVLSGPLRMLKHVYMKDCKIVAESDNARFLRDSESLSGSSAYFENCTFDGFLYSPIFYSSGGSTTLSECEINTTATLHEGSGTIKVIDCTLNQGLSTNPLLITASPPNNDSLAPFLYCDFSGTTVSDREVNFGSFIYAPQDKRRLSILVNNANAENLYAIQGGAVWSVDHNLRIKNSSFKNCNSNLGGGSVYLRNGSLDVDECTIRESDCSVRIVSSVSQIKNSYFAGNDPKSICIGTEAVALIERTLFCETANPFLESQVVDLGFNGWSDSCSDFDCNQNGILDIDEIASGESSDCNLNGIPDSCDLESTFESDCNKNLIPDSCEIADGLLDDCDTDGVPDLCTILESPSQDNNNDGILDRCQCITDINGDGFTDFSDVLQLLSCWGDDLTENCLSNDVTEDGRISFSDLIIMLSNFGPC